MNVSPLPQNRVLVLYAHPAPHKSRANRALVRAAEAAQGVTVHHLYERYPDFIIDVKEEQRLVEAHDVIVMQHPFYWYSAPSLLKEWMDLVLEEGWAYGAGATALRGMRWLQAITCGGSASSYCADGRHQCGVGDFLRPFEKSAALCGMEWLEPFVVYDSGSLSDEQLASEAARYATRLNQLLQGGAS